MKLWRWLLPLISGVLLSFALPDPLVNPPLPGWLFFPALVPLFVLVARSRQPREAFWYGFAFGAPFFASYILWLPQSFAVLLGSFFWVLYPPMVLILASFWGLVTWLSRQLGGPGLGALALLPAFWVLMEWARTQGYFAFPWGTLGYLWLDTPIVQLADTVGTYGLSLLTTVLTALLALPFIPGGQDRPHRHSSWRLPRHALPLLAALGIWAAAWATGSFKITFTGNNLPSDDHSALLVQGNLDPFGRLNTVGEELRIQTDLTARAAAVLAQDPELVIWPEGAVLSSPLEDLPGQPARQEIQTSAPASTFILGAGAFEAASGHWFNSVYSLNNTQVIDRYDKRFLVPFGERWPLIGVAAPLYRAVFGLFGLPLLQGRSPGRSLHPLQTPEGPVAAYICYESVFPQVQSAMVRQGATLLVNITNDAWFARGKGARQHFDMGRMRAIETRRYLLRAGINGITGVIDPLGRVGEVLERGVADTLLVRFGQSTVITPYVRYGRLLIPALLLYLLVVLAVSRLRRQSGVKIVAGNQARPPEADTAGQKTDRP